ncbi:MAG: helix-turn-helix transcriptional regulator [Thermodesulfobacteriota bacterium]
MSIVLDLSKVNRETALRTWLAYHRIRKKWLAEQLGVHRGTVTRIINGQRSSRELIERLVALGIPRDLLPEPAGGSDSTPAN